MATQGDASLMMQIFQWHSQSGGVDALIDLMSADFDAESAAANDRPVLIMLMMGETVGTFVKQGVLDRGLVADLWAPSLMWNLVGPAALRQRSEYGVPELWENFEGLALGTL